MLSIAQLKAISGCANITPGAARGSFGGPSPASKEMALPTELWVHALEYASINNALMAFDVSKAFRSASRFALNKGRWAPVMKVVLAIKSFPWRRHGFAKQKHVDEVKAQFCAAWHQRKRAELVAVFREVERQRKAEERQRRDEEEFREIREMERIAGGW